MLGLRNHRGPALIDAATKRVLDFTDLVELGSAAVDPMGNRKSLLMLYTEQTVSSVVFYAGTMMRGHAVALIDAAGPPELRHGLLERYRPRWVAGPEGTAESLAAAGLAVDEAFPEAGGELVRMGGADPIDVHQNLSLLLSTSGTTGSTKFVRLSRRNVESNATAIAEYLGLDPDERPISSLPLHYTFGLSVLNSHWAIGAPLVLTDRSMLQEAFWDAFTSHGCTSLAGVPFSYQMLERIGFRKRDLPTLQTMLQAGGALDPSLQDVYRRHLEDRAGRFFVMYGQTEATARISYVPPDRLEEKLGSVGIPIPGGSLSIATAEGPTSEPGATGEVVYAGPNVMMGYAEGSGDLALGDKLGGVLHTGDLGRLDDDGFLTLTGRSKRIAKVYGLRVNLDEVEARLGSGGPAAVIADGDQILAFCAFGDDEALETLRLDMARQYRIANAALVLQRVGAIPTTTSGKVDYERVQAWIDS